VEQGDMLGVLAFAAVEPVIRIRVMQIRPPTIDIRIKGQDVERETFDGKTVEAIDDLFHVLPPLVVGDFLLFIKNAVGNDIVGWRQIGFGGCEAMPV
jgi:hypothetical protein